MTTASEILNRAADLVERSYIKRKAFSESGCAGDRLIRSRVDVFNAIGVPSILVSLDIVIGEAAPSAGMQRVPIFRMLDNRLGCNFIDWNNDPNRTQSEVVALLRSVAAEC